MLWGAGPASADDLVKGAALGLVGMVLFFGTLCGAFMLLGAALGA